MNPVVESLLEIVQADPLPAAHTSSHWQRYGREVIAERNDSGLILRAAGFETLHPMGVLSQVLHAVERLSYRPVTSELKSYPRIWRAARDLAHELSSGPNFNVFKSACVLSVLVDHWAEFKLIPKTFALIGAMGMGFLER